MATATKRSKKEQEAEESAQALKQFEESADGESVVEVNEGDDPDETTWNASADGPGVAEPEVTPKVTEEQQKDAIDDLIEEHRKAKAFDEIAALNTEASKAFDAWKRADEVAKGKKKVYEGAVNDLRGLIEKTAHPKAMPLFDKKPAEPEAATTAEVNPPDESWREIPLREALPELSETIHNKLEGAQLFTFGELANWTAENGGRRRLTDIAGIGVSACGKIEEATMAFWQRWKPAAATPEDANTQKAFAARRKFLDTKFASLDIGDGPRMLLDSAKIFTVGELEISASVQAVGIFDKLKSLGMDNVEAEILIDKLNAESVRLAAEGGDS